MEYDIDYEIYKYIDEAADSYVSFSDFLRNNGVTFHEARRKVKNFRRKFYTLLSEYSIRNGNLAETCCDLMERIRQQPGNKELHYLYFCVMTDSGVLNKINSHGRITEQEIRNYFRQNELLHELFVFMKSQLRSSRKLCEIKEYLKNPICIKNNEYAEESELLYNLTIQHDFLYKSAGNKIYTDNLNVLLIYINSDRILKSVKPYLIFAVLTRKTGMIQKRENFMPNLKNLFQYQSYNIYSDNGKNFNSYKSDIELYEHLRRSYSDESYIDMELCNFCFANLSPLSEWYYINCEPNEDIPMNIKRKIIAIMPKSFPEILSYRDYENLDDYEAELYFNAGCRLKEQMLDITEYLI